MESARAQVFMSLLLKRKRSLKVLKILLALKDSHDILLPGKVLTVRTKVGWINEHAPNYSGKDLTGESLKYVTYRYYLYINRYGHISGRKMAS